MKRLAAPAISALLTAFLMACGSVRAAEGGKVLAAAGVKEGSCLVIDADEKLSIALARAGKLRVYLVNPDRKKVDALRLKIEAAKVYGRVTCRAEKLENILLPSYFFDLVVVNGVKLGEKEFAEVYRLVKPGRRAVFAGECGNVTSLFNNLDAPGVKATEIEKAGGLRALRKGYQPTNEYLKPPLVRLWVTCAVQPRCSKGKGKKGTSLRKGSEGEVVTNGCINAAPLDAYTGAVVKPEENYEPSDYQRESAPYLYTDRPDHRRHHGVFRALDRKTGKPAWSFLDDYLYCANCSPFHYANGVVYRSVMKQLLALDARTGKFLWSHRNGGHRCGSVIAARSVLYQPGFPYFRMQAFVSRQQAAGRVPKGDVLTKGRRPAAPGRKRVSPGDWPMFHYDPCRTGNSPDRTIKPPLKLLWKFHTGGGVRASPAIVDGTVYVGSRSHKCYALDGKTGKPKWRFFADDQIHSSICVWRDAVYFGCDDGKVYALNTDSGEPLWTYRTAARAALTPVLSLCHWWTTRKRLEEWLETMRGNRGMRELYSPSRSFSPLCFNGQPLSTPGVVRSSPLVVDGVLYVGTGLGGDARPSWGYLYALDAATGKVVWKIGEEDISDGSEHALGVANSPCFSDGQVHFSYGAYTVVDARDGRLTLKGGTIGRGQRPSYGGCVLPPSCTTRDGKVIRYDAGWFLYDFQGVRGDVAIDRKKQIALAASGAELFAVDMRTGGVKWQGKWTSKLGLYYGRRYYRGNVSFHQPPAIDGNEVYVGGGKGLGVYGLDKGGRDKALIGHYTHSYWAPRIFKPLRVFAGPKDLVNTAPAIANGFIFAGSDDGCIYAWKLDAEKPVWKHKTGGRVRSSPAVARGKLYVGSDDGFVYCFGNE